MKTKTLLLIDAHSILHRTYHALPPLSSPDGTPTGALYGTMRIVLRILEEYNPDYVVAAFDRPEPTFRKQEYKEYKAHRPPTDEDLISQLIEARTLFNILGIALCDAPGFEADDIIGTLASKYSDELSVVIFTGDLDSLQLVSDKISVESFKKGASETIRYTPEKVYERLGVRPEQVPDLKGLTGDASDNIPGVRGVGPKTATALLSEYETLEDFFRGTCTEKKFEKIYGEKDVALISKKLATIRRDVPISMTKEDFVLKKNNEAISEYAKKMGFSSILKKKEPQRLFDISQGAETTKEIAPPQMINGVWTGYDLKEYLKKRNGEFLCFDIKIAAWLLDPDKNTSFETIAETYQTRDFGELKNILEKKMKLEGVFSIFSEIEIPILPVLSEMEKIGIFMDEKKLVLLKHEIEKEKILVEKLIFSETGEEFNIASPIQVSHVLFEKMGIKTKKKKKTKTGMSSTSESALSELKRDNPVVSYVLKYREHSKILSTYVDPLLDRIKEGDGTIRTSFIQTGTATGRFSSEKPNLQNIPQDSEWATPLRDCFVARKGKSFVSFDYSQLELRILAHLSQDEKLKDAFFKKRDVHTITAASVFGVEEKDVVPAMRRIAKTLNFGVIYGMGPRAFSEESGITLEEAKHFINEYFSDFSRVSAWREEIKSETKNGIIRNQNGRLRRFPSWKNSPKWASEFERAAINMPIQSLEADILKIAMEKSFVFIEPYRKIQKANLILTIHDELIFEISDDILNEITSPIKKIMEESYPLSVPLVVDTKTGKTLGSMKKE